MRNQIDSITKMRAHRTLNNFVYSSIGEESLFIYSQLRHNKNFPNFVDNLSVTLCRYLRSVSLNCGSIVTLHYSTWIEKYNCDCYYHSHCYYYCRVYAESFARANSHNNNNKQLTLSLTQSNYKLLKNTNKKTTSRIRNLLFTREIQIASTRSQLIAQYRKLMKVSNNSSQMKPENKCKQRKHSHTLTVTSLYWHRHNDIESSCA